MSSGESLGLELNRRADGGVINVVTTLLGASRLETGRGGSRLPFSDPRCCPRLFFKGAMHAIDGESKTMHS
jgi:hypothetical protein